MEAFEIPIGQNAYTVKTSPGKLLHPTGESTAALIDHPGRAILIASDVPTRRLPAVIAAATAQAWRERLEMYAQDLQHKWDAFSVAADAIADEWIETPNEDDGPQFSAAFDELARLGVRFDPTFAIEVQSWKERSSGPKNKSTLDLFHENRAPSESFVEDHAEDDDADRNDDPDEDNSDNDAEEGSNADPAAPWVVKARRAWLAEQEKTRTPGANVRPFLRKVATAAKPKHLAYLRPVLCDSGAVPRHVQGRRPVRITGEVFFKDASGWPSPCLAGTKGGMTVEQAIAYWPGTSEESLKDLWIKTFRPLVVEQPADGK